jgi:hypothetical protein
VAVSAVRTSSPTGDSIATRSTVVTEARRIDRLLHVHPEQQVIQQKLDVALRLH